jgi:hypothetical protein
MSYSRMFPRYAQHSDVMCPKCIVKLDGNLMFINQNRDGKYHQVCPGCELEVFYDIKGEQHREELT